MREIIVFALDDNEIKALTGSKDEEELSIWRSYIPSPPRITGELIRCKDCKFNKGYCENETFNSHLESLGLDGGALFETSPDFFCAYGKRREE